MDWHGSGWRVALHAFQILRLTVVPLFGWEDDTYKEEENKRRMKIEVVMEKRERKSWIKILRTKERRNVEKCVFLRTCFGLI